MITEDPEEPLARTTEEPSTKIWVPFGYAEVTFAQQDLPLIAGANLAGRGVCQEFLNMDQGWVTFSDHRAPYGRHWAEAILEHLRIPFDAFTASIPNLASGEEREWRSGRWTRQGWMVIRTLGGTTPLIPAPARHRGRCGPLEGADRALNKPETDQPIPARFWFRNPLSRARYISRKRVSPLVKGSSMIYRSD